MNLRKNVRVIIVLVSSILVLMIFYSTHREKVPLNRAHYLHPRDPFAPLLDSPSANLSDFARADAHVRHVVAGPQCRMLDPDPWDASLDKYLGEPPPLVCSRLPPLTLVEQQEDFSNVLKVNKAVIHKYKSRPGHTIKCCFKIITRVNLSSRDYNISADNLYELSNCTEFTEEVYLSNKTEFILVSCKSSPKGKNQGKTVYEDVHPMVPVLPEVATKMRKLEKTQKRLNVLIVGLDSVSKLNLRRTMPRTLKFLQEAQWIELNGYNKVGENTFPNLMAILSGEPVKSLEAKCWANRTQKMEDCPFIWTEYDRKGFVTLYAEDTPGISTFNLLRTGFVKKPTDYYMRPFMVAAHDLLRLKKFNGLPVCLGPVLIVDHVLNYAKRFLRTFNSANYFALLWLNSLSHNDVNAPRALDISVYRFLQQMSKLGTYENSLVLFLSDHGARFGNIRETFLGFLEERLPFMFIWMPKWFREKHPHCYDNLISNRNRLTSPYDVYVTMRKLLNDFNASEALSTACPKCRGLLEKQSRDRSCADASVDVNWCLCSQFRKVPVHVKAAKNIGTYLYRYILDRTAEFISKGNVNRSLCAEWKFVKVFRVDEIILPKTPHQYSLRDANNVEIERHENEEMGDDTKMYVIIIQLNPGNTKFESTVRMRENGSANPASFALLEPPKRLDSIYKTSKCVDNLLLKQYCYCAKR